MPFSFSPGNGHGNLPLAQAIPMLIPPYARPRPPEPPRSPCTATVATIIAPHPHQRLLGASQRPPGDAPSGRGTPPSGRTVYYPRRGPPLPPLHMRVQVRTRGPAGGRMGTPADARASVGAGPRHRVYRGRAGPSKGSGIRLPPKKGSSRSRL